MAEQLPINFAIPAENIITSYDYTDVASGQGYSRFYLAVEAQGGSYTVSCAGTPSYILTDQQIYSNNMDITSTGTNADTLTETNTVSFNSSVFNTPRVLKGNVLFSLCLGAHAAVGGTGYGAVKASLKIVSGGVTTTLCTTDLSSSADGGGTSAPGVVRRVFMVETITERNIKVGDYLVLDIIFFCANPSGTSGHIGYCDLGTDPYNRNGSWIQPSSAGYTNSFIEIPFKIDT